MSALLKRALLNTAIAVAGVPAKALAAIVISSQVDWRDHVETKIKPFSDRIFHRIWRA